MIRQTSAQAYEEIKEKNLLGRMQMLVYDLLYQYEGWDAPTALELNAKSARHINSISQIRARLTELREMGLLEETGKRKCSVSGKNAITWRTTNMLPAQARKNLKRGCYWKEGDLRIWKSSCNHNYQHWYSVGYTYCPGCSKRIVRI